jgi:glucokinase
MILAGDIGGTKTHLGIFSTEEGFRHPLVEAEFASALYPNLESIVKEFLNQVNHPVRMAVFGVAGPVVGGRARITNLPWIMDEKKLCDILTVSSVRLINDLEAIACTLPFLEPSDLSVLSEGNAIPGGNIAIIAPGTGLGEAFLIWDGSSYRGYASEGGHTDFAPTNPLEDELLHYLRTSHNHVSYEMVCSGQGVGNIYRFLRDRHPTEEPSRLPEKLEQEEYSTPMIVEAALNSENSCGLCVKTVRLFASILGAEAGNVALKFLATGGVFIAGGMSRRILPFLEDCQFMESFRRKGRLSDLVSRIPVYVITYPKVALLGVVCYASKYLL